MRKDRKKQVETTKQKNGTDWYKVIGQKGGLQSPTKFTSETGKINARKRWDKIKEQTNG